MSQAQDDHNKPIDQLLGIMASLRSEEGCPWDREQSLSSLKPYLIEEAYELLEVMDGDDTELHCEELGDLLLQVVFQAQIRNEQGAFDFDQVAKAISEKLIRRHPHVFGQTKLHSTSEVLEQWDDIKKEEKRNKGTSDSILSGVPRSMPALLKAQEVQKRAARVGFDWPSLEGPLDKLEEEMAELKQALSSGKKEKVEDEIGDLLFSLVNCCRHLNLQAEHSLEKATQKFMDRFKRMEQTTTLNDKNLEELDVLWEGMKQQPHSKDA